MLPQVNKTLAVLRLEGNRITSEGAIAIAQGLANNKTLRELYLSNQTQKTFGDQCLTEYAHLLEVNLTLLKIAWRLDSRKGFALSKMLTRNNEINRRLKTGKEFKV